MTEGVNLVADLALILISAGVVTIISKALKQPLILGYLIAGFLVGPHLGIFPSVVNTDSVKQWSDIGIIFLLFALGLEFSFKKLLKVGSSAIITSGTICIGMMVVGLTVGSALGWTMMECVFLGGLMSMSSTTIIIKAYDEMGYKNKPYAPLVFGALVVEDMIAVLLMVLLSTLAVSQKFSGGEMLFNLAKLAFFIILWFLSGIFLIPTILKKAEKYLNDEILLIVSLGLCFTMVVLAEEVGFSSALGAFLMGSILSETLQSEKIQKLVLPIKDLFGAVFFVSVGMMVNPAVIVAHWGTILVLTITAVVGIIIFCTAGALLSRQGLDNSLHMSFSMAQLGEFSFIIAGLGCSLGVMREFIYPVIIAVSVITTFTTPYMIKAATPVSAFLKKKLPEKWLSALSSQDDQKSSSAAEESDWKKLIKSYALRILLYSVVLIAILIGGKTYLNPLAQKIFPSLSETLREIICLSTELALMSPFLYGLGVSSSGLSVSARKLLRCKSSNKWPILAMALLRALIAVFFVIMAIFSFFKLEGWALFLILLTGITVIIIARRTMNRVSFVEQKFLSNLSQKEKQARDMAPVAVSVKENLSEFDISTLSLSITPDSRFAGMPLREMPFRTASGVNIVKITRPGGTVLIPSGEEILFPGDILLAVGTSLQLENFKTVMSSQAPARKPSEVDFCIIKTLLDADSYLTGRMLRATTMRSAGCMAICVKRGEEIITNPSADFRFAVGDEVWLAGDRKACEWFK